MSKKEELIAECRRLEESCLYTSTSFYIWLKRRKIIKNIFITVPLVLGAAASWRLLTGSDLESVKVLTSIFAFVAGVMPTVYSALKYDDRLEKCADAAAEFKNLQDKFRQLANIFSQKSFKEFEEEFFEAMERMEKVREKSITPPEKFFKKAQKKVKKGDYEFDSDLK